MSNIKEAVAKNITKLRQARGLTQLELAEKLNYSDKAISKWERGESTPDISVLAEIADLFEVPFDYLIKSEHSDEHDYEYKKPEEFSRSIITAVSVLTVWFCAVLAFVLTALIRDNYDKLWLCFVYAVTVSGIVWLVFNSIWFNKKVNFLIISLLMWSALVSVHLSLLAFGIDVWLIYMLGIPAQIIIILWSAMKRRPKKKK